MAADKTGGKMFNLLSSGKDNILVKLNPVPVDIQCVNRMLDVFPHLIVEAVELDIADLSTASQDYQELPS